jgi:hypothetical protein
MIFIDNKYTRWYYNIVNRATTRTITGYTEKHHIVPKSCGGTNSKDNLVALTAKEHFICHLLLTKMVAGHSRHKMVYAFHGLKAKQLDQIRHTSKLVNAKLYQKLKEELSLLKKSKEPWNKGKKGAQVAWNKGKPMSEETKQKLREARANQDMSYRKGTKMSEEQKQKLRDARAKQIITDETRKKLSIASTGRKHTEESKSKMRENWAKKKLLG